jgi:PEP-CTERM motif
MTLSTKLTLTVVGISALAMLAFMAPAHAAPCTVVKTVGNVHFLSGASDPQCNDGDDLKMFLDGVTNSNTAFGSLGGNNNSTADSNIKITDNGGSGGFAASTDANGFANFKSVVDNVDFYQLQPQLGTFLPKTGAPFLGFDGSLMRGQLTNNPNTPGVKWDGDVSIVVNLSTGVTDTFTFKGFKAMKDIGVIGFDEVLDPGVFVKSYLAVAGDVTAAGVPIAKGLGSWDEFKQIEMSVPGAVAVIPEPSTWVMILAGFGLMGLMARKSFAQRPSPTA